MRLVARNLLLGLLGGAGLPSLASAVQTPGQDTVLTPAPFERELTGAQRLPLPGAEDYRQVESERGWVITDDSAEAPKIIVAVRTAAARFEQIFEKPVFRGLVLFDVEGFPKTGLATIPELPEFLDSVGIRWDLSLETSNLVEGISELRPLWEEHERARLQRQRPLLTEAQREDSLAQRFADRTDSLFHEYSLLRHEMAHRWAQNATLWPRGTQSAPWLTEAVAILMEGPQSRKYRWDAMVRRYKNDPAQLMPMDTFFTVHPPSYSQATAMIDFLDERTGDSTIFRSIIASDARGATMADWLRENGPRYGLPTTMSEFEEQWRQWFVARVAKE